MRDIWATPPGGPVAAAVQPKRYLKTAIATGLVILLGLGVGGVLRWMGASTAVSQESVLAQFRAERGSDPVVEDEQQTEGQSRSEARREGQKTGPANRKSKAQRRAASTQGSGAGVSSTAVGSSGSGSSTGSASRGNDASSGQRPDEGASLPGRPEEGVYTWAIDGYERAPGTNRALPEESHRVITWEGQSGWTEHHIFSEQKETWLDLQFSDEGVSVTRNRNRVVMGPVTVDKTIVFDPAMFVGLFPFKVGETWEGSWRGKTSGEYKARTFEHTTLMIGGEKVEVWATEVRMTMRGEVAGTATVRSWVAPEYKLVVKQYQDTRVTTGPGEYRSEWTGQVKSLQPQR